MFFGKLKRQNNVIFRNTIAIGKKVFQLYKKCFNYSTLLVPLNDAIISSPYLWMSKGRCVSYKQDYKITNNSYEHYLVHVILQVTATSFGSLKKVNWLFTVPLWIKLEESSPPNLVLSYSNLFPLQTVVLQKGNHPVQKGVKLRIKRIQRPMIINAFIALYLAPMCKTG